VKINIEDKVMIFVQGTMNMNPAIIADFARDVAEMRPKVLPEDGCLHYSLLVEDAATGLVNVIEQWRDDAALVAHLGMPWIAEFFAKYVGHMQASTVQIFDISGNARPLPGM
jgi:quinol monooxygenase YgiN